MNRAYRLLATGCCLIPFLAACDWRIREIRIAAQDHRFVPARIQAQARESIHLVIVNEGRETHEFSSELLTDPHVHVRSEDVTPKDYSPSHSFKILPGRTVKITFRAPRGNYLFRCKIPGHRNMTATLIVE